MPSIDTESQFKFLIACIKHSQAGKVCVANLSIPINDSILTALLNRLTSPRLPRNAVSSPKAPRKYPQI